MAIINDVVGQPQPDQQPVQQPAQQQPVAEGQDVQQQEAQKPMPEGGFDQEPTPELQDAYERVVLAGVSALYDDSTSPEIVKMLSAETAGSPAERLARTTTTIFLELDEQSGGQIPEEVILPASAEILEQTGELADRSGAFPVDQALLDKAAQLLVVELSEQYGFEPEDAQALINEVPPEELNTLVAQQQQVSQSLLEDEAVTAQQPSAPDPDELQEQQPVQQPAQQLPGIINQVIGG